MLAKAYLAEKEEINYNLACCSKYIQNEQIITERIKENFSRCHVVLSLAMLIGTHTKDLHFI